MKLILLLISCRWLSVLDLSVLDLNILDLNGCDWRVLGLSGDRLWCCQHHSSPFHDAPNNDNNNDDNDKNNDDFRHNPTSQTLCRGRVRVRQICIRWIVVPTVGVEAVVGKIVPTFPAVTKAASRIARGAVCVCAKSPKKNSIFEEWSIISLHFRAHIFSLWKWEERKINSKLLWELERILLADVPIQYIG